MWVCDVVWSRLTAAPVSICFLVGLVAEACDTSVSLWTLVADSNVIPVILIHNGEKWNGKNMVLNHALTLLYMDNKSF